MNPTKLNLAVIGLVVVLTAGFGLGVARPGLRALEAHREQLTLEALQAREEHGGVGDISDLYASIVELNQRMQDFRERLPQEREFGEFLNYLAEQLRNCGIEDFAVEPRQSVSIDEEKLPESAQIVRGTQVLPVRVAFEGRFEEIVEFLRRMEELPRLSHVEQMEMTNSERRPGRVRVEMLIHTYYRREV